MVFFKTEVDIFNIIFWNELYVKMCKWNNRFSFSVCHDYVCLLIEKRMREDFLSNAHGYQKYMHNYSE